MLVAGVFGTVRRHVILGTLYEGLILGRGSQQGAACGLLPDLQVYALSGICGQPAGLLSRVCKCDLWVRPQPEWSALITNQNSKDP